MFQGGFVGTECRIKVKRSCEQLVHVDQNAELFFPNDINDLQYFPLTAPIYLGKGDLLQIKFLKSSDFYGRITVYMIDFFGNEC